MKFWLRLLVYGIAGPVVGGLVTLAAFGPLASLWGGRGLSLRDDIVPMIPAIVFLSYALGTIPALVTGALDATLVARGLPARRRLAWCALAGAVLSVPAAIAIIGRIPDTAMLAVGLAGALASVACGVLAARIFDRPEGYSPLRAHARG